MPPSPTLIARDHRILAGHAAGATILQLALVEEIDPATVRRVLRDAGITPGATRQTKLNTNASRLADPTLGRAGGGIGQEPGCPARSGVRSRTCPQCRDAQEWVLSEAAGADHTEAGRLDSIPLRSRQEAKRFAEQLGLPVKRARTAVLERGVPRRAGYIGWS